MDRWGFDDSLIFLVQYLCDDALPFKLFRDDLGNRKALEHKATLLQQTVIDMAFIQNMASNDDA
jgi:hypothetical protein